MTGFSSEMYFVNALRACLGLPDLYGGNHSGLVRLGLVAERINTVDPTAQVDLTRRADGSAVALTVRRAGAVVLEHRVSTGNSAALRAKVERVWGEILD